MEEVSLLKYCEQKGKTELIRQWSVPENQDFDPEKTGFASHKKIWWVCEKGHKWQAMISDRVKKDAGCPYCTNRKAWKGFNDLASTCPELASQWHPTKNGELTPEMVTYGSDKYVWWQCELGHEWKATVGNRATKGHECPYCTGKKAWPGFNDLATLEPQLMKEWHPMFNLGISPRKLRPGSGKKVWWKCPEGHEWEAVIANRTKRRSGCPFCAGNMAKGKAIEWTAYAMRKEAELRQVGLFGQREDAGKNEILKKNGNRQQGMNCGWCKSGPAFRNEKSDAVWAAFAGFDNRGYLREFEGCADGDGEIKRGAKSRRKGLRDVIE